MFANVGQMFGSMRQIIGLVREMLWFMSVTFRSVKPILRSHSLRVGFAF